MGPLHWLMLAGMILAAVVVLFCLLFRADNSSPNYQIQRFFISGQERKLWHALQRAVGNDYMVLPKVPLASLLGGEGNKESKAWLNERWADYAIFEEKFLKPVAIVQFERQQKSPLWAPGKDPTLHKISAAAGLPLLWLPSAHYQHVELLRHALEQVLAAGSRANQDL